MSERESGIVKWYKADKGFGFIISQKGIDVFMHRSAFYGDPDMVLIEGQEVGFTMSHGPRGPQALEIRPV